MEYIIYAALSIRAQTEKTTFSCKDDFTLTKHTRRWRYLLEISRFRAALYRRCGNLFYVRKAACNIPKLIVASYNFAEFIHQRLLKLFVEVFRQIVQDFRVSSFLRDAFI